MNSHVGLVVYTMTLQHARAVLSCRVHCCKGDGLGVLDSMHACCDWEQDKNIVRACSEVHPTSLATWLVCTISAPIKYTDGQFPYRSRTVEVFRRFGSSHDYQHCTQASHGHMWVGKGLAVRSYVSLRGND